MGSRCSPLASSLSLSWLQGQLGLAAIQALESSVLLSCGLCHLFPASPSHAALISICQQLMEGQTDTFPLPCLILLLRLDSPAFYSITATQQSGSQALPASLHYPCVCQGVALCVWVGVMCGCDTQPALGV